MPNKLNWLEIISYFVAVPINAGILYCLWWLHNDHLVWACIFAAVLVSNTIGRIAKLERNR